MASTSSKRKLKLNKKGEFDSFTEFVAPPIVRCVVADIFGSCVRFPNGCLTSRASYRVQLAVPTVFICSPLIFILF